MSMGNPSERTVRAINRQNRRKQAEARYDVKVLKTSLDNLYAAFAELPDRFPFVEARKRIADAMFRQIELVAVSLDLACFEDTSFMDEIRELAAYVERLNLDGVRPPVVRI